VCEPPASWSDNAAQKRGVPWEEAILEMVSCSMGFVGFSMGFDWFWIGSELTIAGCMVKGGGGNELQWMVMA
jgi:hypothetical protein